MAVWGVFALRRFISSRRFNVRKWGREQSRPPVGRAPLGKKGRIEDYANEGLHNFDAALNIIKEKEIQSYD